MKSTPYRCPVCLRPSACGFNGLLYRGRGPTPTCDHHKGHGKPCHDQPVKMEPSK
jgi:hypothetical protein